MGRGTRRARAFELDDHPLADVETLVDDAQPLLQRAHVDPAVFDDVFVVDRERKTLALVQADGFAIIDVTTREADLEDVFVTLTSAAKETVD